MLYIIWNENNSIKIDIAKGTVHASSQMIPPLRKYNNYFLKRNGKTIFFSDIELTQITKAQGQNIFSGPRQSLFQVFVSYHFQLQDMT